MSQRRVIFLVGTLLILYCIAFLSNSWLNKDNARQNAAAPNASISPANPPVISVYFVPVTAYNNVLIDDLSEVQHVFIAEAYYASMADAAIWTDLGIELAVGEDTIFEPGHTIERNTALLIPMANITPHHRILTLHGVSIFDTSQKWPLTLQLSADANLAITPEMVHELVFGGTVVLSRGVAERIERYDDISYPWAEIANTLQSADYAFINFKGPITSDCEYNGGTLQFCGRPEYVKGMADAGVDGVSVSGNHIGDYGQSGMAETIRFLDEYNIEHTGLGNTYESASKPIIMSFGETTIGVLAYNNVPGTSSCATEVPSWGITCLIDETAVKAEIASLSENVDIVVIYPNWGPEYVHTPHDTAQIAWGRFFVEAGADIVLGDQAHWVQTMELYQDAPIYYGLGNIVFDQMWSDKTTEGLLVKVYVANGRILTTEPLATKIYDYAQPKIETGTLRDTILSYLTLPVEN